MEPSERRKVIIIVIITVVCVIGLIIYGALPNHVSFVEGSVGTILKPVQTVFTDISNGFGHFTSYFTQFDAMTDENKTLKKKVLDMEKKLDEYESLKEENDRLKGLLKIQERNPQSTYVAAEVISKEASNWFYSFTINKGTIDGIKRLDPVVTDIGLVGYISEAGPTYSKVTSIIDSESAVGAKVIRTKDIAILEGDYELSTKGQCKLSYIPKEANLINGDLVETSGLGDIFPQGLTIGRVIDVLPEPHGIGKYAVIEPVVDFKQIKEVFVISSFKQ